MKLYGATVFLRFSIIFVTVILDILQDSWYENVLFLNFYLQALGCVQSFVIMMEYYQLQSSHSRAIELSGKIIAKNS